MRVVNLRTVLITAAVCLATGAAVLADQRPAQPITAIQVSDMHCAACAKKIARKLYAVAGVVQVKTDLKKHTAVVVPQKDRQLDPLALWEAVEAAGFAPVRLEGPSGTFTSKKDLQASAASTQNS
jgi:copper chaperone CopZ